MTAEFILAGGNSVELDSGFGSSRSVFNESWLTFFKPGVNLILGTSVMGRKMIRGTEKVLRSIAVAGVQGHRRRHRLWSVAVSTKLSFISEGEIQCAVSQEVKRVMWKLRLSHTQTNASE